MKIQRVLIALTVVNLVLLVFLMAQIRPVTAQNIAPVLRGRALEIVDEQGRVRATLNIQPAHTMTNGESFPETVLFRLINERQRPAVKISTSDQGSGLMLTGGSRTVETYLTMGATGTASSLKLKNEDGREQLVRP
jgi:hypothetical protein